jgi:hypothetical protein
MKIFVLRGEKLITFQRVFYVQLQFLALIICTLTGKKTNVIVSSKGPENTNNKMDDDALKQVPKFE